MVLHLDIRCLECLEFSRIGLFKNGLKTRDVQKQKRALKHQNDDIRGLDEGFSGKDLKLVMFRAEKSRYKTFKKLYSLSFPGGYKTLKSFILYPFLVDIKH